MSKADQNRFSVELAKLAHSGQSTRRSVPLSGTPRSDFAYAILITFMAGTFACNAGWFSGKPDSDNVQRPTLSQKLFGYTPKPTTAEKVGGWLANDGVIQKTIKGNPFTRPLASYVESNYQPPEPVEGIVPKAVREAKQAAPIVLDVATEAAEVYVERTVQEANLRRQVERQENTSARRSTDGWRLGSAGPVRPAYEAVAERRQAGLRPEPSGADGAGWDSHVPTRTSGLFPSAAQESSLSGQSAAPRLDPLVAAVPQLGQFERSILFASQRRVLGRVESGPFGRSQVYGSAGRSVGRIETSASGTMTFFDSLGQPVRSAVSSRNADTTTVFDSGHRVVLSALKDSFGRSTLFDGNHRKVGELDVR